MRRRVSWGLSVALAALLLSACGGDSAPLAATATPTSQQPTRAKEHFATGFELIQQGNYEEAIEQFDEALSLDPQYAAAYNNRGTAYDDLGLPTRAIQDYDDAIRLNPQYADAYYNRGITYNNVPGQRGRAIQDFDEAIRLDPQHKEAYGNRGSIYTILGQPERAIEDFDEVIRLDPQYAVGYANRAIAYTLLGMDTKAQQDVERAIALGFPQGPLEASIEEKKSER